MGISGFKDSIKNIDNSFAFYKEINWKNSRSTDNPVTDKFLSSGVLLTLKDNEIDGLKAGMYLKLVVTNGKTIYVDMSGLETGAGAITNAQIAKGTITRDKIDETFEASISALEQKLAGSDMSVVEQINNAINVCNTYTDSATAWIQL